MRSLRTGETVLLGRRHTGEAELWHMAALVENVAPKPDAAQDHALLEGIENRQGRVSQAREWLRRHGSDPLLADRVRELERDALARPLLVLDQAGLRGARFLHGGLACSWDSKGWVRAWDPFTGREQSRWRLGKSMVQAVVANPVQRRLVAGTEKGWFSCIRLSFGLTPSKNYAGHSVWSAAVSADGETVAVGGRDPMVSIFDWPGDQPPRLKLGPHSEFISALLFLPDGKLVVGGGTYEDSLSSANHLWLWDLQSGKQLWRVPLLGQAIHLALHPDGRSLLLGDGGGGVRVISLEAGKLGGYFAASVGPPVADFLRDRAHGGAIGGLGILSDGKHLLTCSAGRIYQVAGGRQRSNDLRLWDLGERRLLRTFRAGTAEKYASISVSPDGGLVLFVTRKAEQVEVWLTSSVVSGAFR